MIHVAVIARAGSPTLPGCLAALRAAGSVAPTVVEVGPDGPAQARNRALAGCRQRILALVEDDVVVVPGWLDAVNGAWRDPLVAVAGGPLEGPPEVTGPAPTYPGGNVAFRTAALRGAGGFWPARGDPDARDWFSEEHEAQRELARMGWQSAFVPGMRARRVGAEPSLTQRLRRGARRQALGEPRPPADALRGVVTSLGGATLGHRRERLGRAAESLGSLLGERVVRDELEPVTTSTPFAGSVPPSARQRGRSGAGGRGRPASGARAGARRRAARGRPRILAYHRFTDPAEDPLGLAVSPAHFAEHADVLRTREVVPLEAVAAGEAGPDAIAVTVDDGYADSRTLRELGLPVTLFVCTGPVATGRGFWWDAVAAACRVRAGERVDVGDRAFVLGPVAQKHLQRWLQLAAPDEIDAALARLRASAPGTAAATAPGAHATGGATAPDGAAASGGAADRGAGPPSHDDRALTIDELRELAGHVTIGAHTRSHRSLAQATPEEQRAEIEGSRDDLAAWLGTVPTAFAYPYGIPGEAFTAATAALVRAAGFTCAVANTPDAPRDRFALPRVPVPDVDGEAFARLLA